MKTVSAHVTGFYHSSFHAYTTEVNVDGHRWRLGLRYSKFHEFYDQLLLADKAFHAAFPPKGTLFFTPKPEERQEQLEAFLQQVLAHYAARGHPAEIEELLCNLLKVPRHLRAPEHEDDDDVSTSTESVLDEPVNEPPSSSDSFRLEEEERGGEEKTQQDAVEAKDTADAAAPAEQDPAQDMEPEAAAKKVETVAAPEPVQPASPVAEEACPVEVETADTHEDAEALVETPASAEEADTGITKEVSAPVEEKLVPEEVAVAEEAATVVQEEAAEAVAEPQAEEPKVVLSERQPVVKPVAQKEEPVSSEPRATKNPSDISVAAPKQEAEKKKELEVSCSSSGVSSWLAAFLPKSLLAFVRHRCMKKTNLVVLCVALLLPMVLARR
ncbi:hypothetical protein PR003_g8821 [Phytophthora rubi]|uniref:PX domain-containing protein n=1 Tax=Phytophthora rubi TaxID=129364 RepID=A0A6A4FI01_9STRA|nr:hypothetical protein PR002_g8464 [Phytophthora rubi]KAE9343737.1 hypothetical protein PR003_g8821 [Phytophthora rubi]